MVFSSWTVAINKSLYLFCTTTLQTHFLLRQFLCCGVYHGFIPIAVEVVSLDDYLVWLDSQT